MAEGVGFEPTGLATNGFQDRRIKPLCHPSTRATSSVRAPEIQPLHSAASACISTGTGSSPTSTTSTPCSAPDSNAGSSGGSTTWTWNVAGPVAVVHNGIIENHLELRADLEADGFTMSSDTDTEIISHLIHRETRAGHDLVAAIRRSIEHVEGAYAIAVLSENEPERVVVAKSASPLVIGVSNCTLVA